MTPKEQAAMQQALEALEFCKKWASRIGFDAAITALREALAEQSYDEAHGISSYHLQETEQAEQEPVAWRWSESNGERWFDWRTDWTKHDEALRLGFKVEYAYAAPVRTKDLTDDEIVKVFNDVVGAYGHVAGLYKIDFARSVIAADREKNNANNNS